MNLPECITCDESRRPLCSQLFEGFARIEVDGTNELLEATEGVIDVETLDVLKGATDGSAHRALKTLSQWGCELTVEQVEQRLFLVKESIREA